MVDTLPGVKSFSDFLNLNFHGIPNLVEYFYFGFSLCEIVRLIEIMYMYIYYAFFKKNDVQIKLQLFGKYSNN